MKINLYNEKGIKTGEADLPGEIFGLELNPDLVYQVAIAQASHQRQPIAQTKNRGEVRGGGKKPWPQKGTGRARHGSIRSPLWKGGGVVFGPRNEKKFQKKIPVKMRIKALFMVLSEKARQGLLILLEELRVKEGKTKEVAGVLKNLPVYRRSTLLVLPTYDKKTLLAARNIPKIKVMEARELNVLDLLNHQYLILLKESVEVVKKTFLESKKMRKTGKGGEDAKEVLKKKENKEK